MIEPQHPRLSVARQCELVSISRSGFYHQPAGETPLNLALMRLIDAQFLETPWYGSRQMARHLRREGYVGLALNFATFRAVLASETGDRLVHRVEKWFLERMSDSMQIESLWTFNEKFQPEWHPRYACYDSPEHLLAASIMAYVDEYARSH